MPDGVVYNGASNAPSTGTNNPTGYVERALNNPGSPVPPGDSSQQSNSRSGLAGAMLRQLQANGSNSPGGPGMAQDYFNTRVTNPDINPVRLPTGQYVHQPVPSLGAAQAGPGRPVGTGQGPLPGVIPARTANYNSSSSSSSLQQVVPSRNANLGGNLPQVTPPRTAQFGQPQQAQPTFGSNPGVQPGTTAAAQPTNPAALAGLPPSTGNLYTPDQIQQILNTLAPGQNLYNDPAVQRALAELNINATNYQTNQQGLLNRELEKVLLQEHDLQQKMPTQLASLLANYGHRGMAFSSGYGVAADNARAAMERQLDMLQRQGTNYQSDYQHRLSDYETTELEKIAREALINAQSADRNIGQTGDVAAGLGVPTAPVPPTPTEGRVIGPDGLPVGNTAIPAGLPATDPYRSVIPTTSLLSNPTAEAEVHRNMPTQSPDQVAAIMRQLRQSGTSPNATGNWGAAKKSAAPKPAAPAKKTAPSKAAAPKPAKKAAAPMAAKKKGR